MILSEQDQSVFRWGGWAGIAGSIVFLIVFIVVGVFVGENPIELAAWVERFPEIRAARTVENGLYLLVLVLWVPHFVALFWALRSESLAPALFGTVLGIVGLTVMIAGALPHVTTVPLADLYHAPGASAADQTTLALMWQGAWGINDSFLYGGLAVVAAGLTLLGVAMLNAEAFGPVLSWLTVAFGVGGMAAAVLLLINPDSLAAVINVFSLIIFHGVVGWKVQRLGGTSPRISPVREPAR